MQKGPNNDHPRSTPPSSVEAPGIVNKTPPQLGPPPPLPLSELVNQAVRPAQPTDIVTDVKGTLPPGIELHRAYRYQSPILKNTFDILVLKLNVPARLERKLTEWRTALEDRHPRTHIFIKRVEIKQNLQNNLVNRFRSSPVIGTEGIPTLKSMIDSLCGVEPPTSTSPRVNTPARENLTAVPFIAIDRAGTLDQEDLVYGERKADGSLMLRVAVIDITDHITPGSARDKFGMRVGTAIYSRHRVISPVGSLRTEEAAFKQGEKRPAWVVECRVHPSKPSAEYFKIRRAWVVNHANLDPSRPFDPNSDKDIAKNLSALAEITRILEHRRTQRSSFIRIDGDGAAAKIVAETMVHSRWLIAKYLKSHSPSGVIYRVHPGPSAQIAECLQELHELKIPASKADFEPPFTGFPGILHSLENRNTREAHSLANKILDSILLKAKFSTEDIGHFGLGGIEYVEPKPRAGGIPIQFLLDSIFTGASPLSTEELIRRADQLNDKRWSRDETMYKLRFLEMLAERLREQGHIFLGQVTRIGKGYLLCEVDTFGKWGRVPRSPDMRFSLGDAVALKLEGFNVRRMRFEFSVVEA